jgi:hypothetical protein
VSLLSTEAEHHGIASVASMVKLIQMLLEEIDPSALRPALIFEDNVGAMFLVTNRHDVGARTKNTLAYAYIS